MALPDNNDRLQPALLDRLTDDAPTQRTEPAEKRLMTRAQLRQAVLRDLGWLFNAVQPQARWAETHPAMAASVLNFGLPPLSGQRLSQLDISQLERAIQQAILRFEPRIKEETLRVRAVEAGAVLDMHNVIEFEISGFLWADPVPIEILFRTKLDLEAGQAEVHDASTVSALRRA